MRVKWMGIAREKIRNDLVSRLQTELAEVFPSGQIIVYDCLTGHRADQEARVVLAVEVQTKGSYTTPIVKLGAAHEVRCDYEAWRRCSRERPIGGRVFVDVTGRRLPRNRAAAVYQNAYTLFGRSPLTGPQSLEDAVLDVVLFEHTDPLSLERVIRQIFGDLHEWFYWKAQPKIQEAVQFYQARLKKAISAWTPPAQRSGSATLPLERWHLRQDAIWLFCGCDSLSSPKACWYVDPYDYVSWAMKRDEVPETLVGRAHGDLHGRNILLGVRRGEAEFPIVIDYGEMGDANVLVWDFVKLEVELKTKILPALFQDLPTRRAMLARVTKRPWRRIQGLDDPQRPIAHATAEGEIGPSFSERNSLAADRAKRLAFLYEFESILNEATSCIGGSEDVEGMRMPEQQVLFPDAPMIDRALRILLRIRQEAALYLGYRRPGRHLAWRDEYYFAIAVFALATGKWENYEKYRTEVALISGGMALPQTQLAARTIASLLTARRMPDDVPCYRIPLWHAHRLWIRRDLRGAEKIMEKAREPFRHAGPLQVEDALIKAEKGIKNEGELTEALETLRPLAGLAAVFGDYETLSRVGRVAKQRGDQAWERMWSIRRVPFNELYRLVPWQYYGEAHRWYLQAYRLNGHHFPGVNAATTALLSGQPDVAKSLAQEVLDICASPPALPAGTDLYWLFATEGEAALISGEPMRAAEYYDEALQTVGPDEIRAVQSSWNQICRLWHALGADVIGPAVQVFQEHTAVWSRLEPGPLGNCGIEMP